MSANRNRIIVHFDEQGAIKVATDQRSDVFIVDERVPRDRVYKYTLPGMVVVGRDKVDAVLGNSPVGHFLYCPWMAGD